MGWVYGNKMNHDINRVGVIWWCYRTFHYYLHLRLNRMLLMDNLEIRDIVNQERKKQQIFFYGSSCSCLSRSINTTTVFDFIMSCCCVSAFHFFLLSICVRISFLSHVHLVHDEANLSVLRMRNVIACFVEWT